MESHSPTWRSSPPAIPRPHSYPPISGLRVYIFPHSSAGIRSRLACMRTVPDTCLGRKAPNSITRGANEFPRLNPAGPRGFARRGQL